MSMKIFTDRLINVTQKLSELRYTTSGLAFATMVALFATALTMGTAAQATISAAGRPLEDRPKPMRFAISTTPAILLSPSAEPRSVNKISDRCG
jgi:hypothetical protein